MARPINLVGASGWRITRLVLVLVLSACTMGSPDAEVVQKVVDRFYQAEQQDMDSAVKFYSDDRSPEEWRLHLENIADSLGKVETYQFKRVEVNTVFSGRFYIFEYEVSYSSGKNAKETLSLYDTVESDDEPSIVAHVISADGYKPLF